VQQALYEPRRDSVTLLDVLDRILDKGVVIIGDITVSLCDVELLSIKLKLLIASVDKAREIGVDMSWTGLKKPRVARARRDKAMRPKPRIEPLADRNEVRRRLEMR